MIKQNEKQLVLVCGTGVWRSEFFGGVNHDGLEFPYCNR